MAIKLPDPGNGIPEQKTGNDEWTNMKIVRDNFADQTHAASKLVGTARGQMPLTEQVAAAYLTNEGANAGNRDANDFEVGTIYRTSGTSANTPVGSGYWSIRTFPAESGVTSLVQIANCSAAPNAIAIRGKRNGVWTEWTSLSSYTGTYLTTTATGANVVVSASGQLTRASSSLKYKDVISKLELDSDLYNKAMQVQPIIYRSKSKIDPKDWHFMSFVAEELGELEPSLTQWRTHDYDDKGELVELEQKEAEGINLNAICAVLHATNIYQDKKLQELEKRLTTLEQTDEPAI